MKCNRTKLDGSKCQAFATNGSDTCYRHNVATKEQALEASSSGGKARRQYHQLGKKMKLESPKDIKKLMAKAINSLWTGNMPSNNPASSLGYLSKTFLDAHDKSDLEARVEDLEKRIELAKL